MTTVSTKIIREYMDSHSIIGTRLVRCIEVEGIENTAGDAEAYRVMLDGFYNDGSLRFDVHVQRPNGSFALLNSNRHYQRISLVKHFIADAVAEYRKDNATATA
jgi:hypothetical protein